MSFTVYGGRQRREEEERDTIIQILGVTAIATIVAGPEAGAVAAAAAFVVLGGRAIFRSLFG